MNISQGPHHIDDTLTFSVTTHTPSTGAAADADAVPDYRVYEDETGTAILTGSMAKLDDANTLGFYSEQITLSAANGFEVGKSYNIYVSAAVGSVTGTISAGFRVHAPIATQSSVDTIDGIVDAIVADTNELQTDLVNGGRLDLLIDAIKAKTDNLPADPADASDIAASFTTIAGYLDTEIAAILADTNELQIDLADGGRLDLLIDAIKAKTDALPTDPADQSALEAAITAATSPLATQASVDVIDANVDSILADTSELQTDFVDGGRLDLLIDAIKAKTDALPSDPADASDIAASFSSIASTLTTIAAYIDTEVAAILADTNELQIDWVNGGRLDLLLDAIKAVTDKLNDTLEDDLGTYRFTTNALEQAPSGGGGGDATEANQLTIIGYLDTEIAAIKAKTDNLPADPADASDISSAFSTVNSMLSTIAGYIDTEIAAIKAKTDNLPTDPADASDIAASFSSIASTLTTISNYLDTEVAAILADTTELQADLTNGGRLDLILDAILEDTGTTLPAQIAALNLGGGSGAYTITVTVTDGTDPLQNALVRLTEGVNTFTLSTDVSGNAQFSLDAATYNVSVTKDGYSFTPTTRTVTGTETGTLINDLEMTLTVIPTPAAPPYCAVFGTLVDGVGDPVANATISFSLVSANTTSRYGGPFSTLGGSLIQTTTIIGSTDANGTFGNGTEGSTSLDLIRTDYIQPAAVWYLRSADIYLRNTDRLTLTSGTYDLSDLTS